MTAATIPEPGELNDEPERLLQILRAALPPRTRITHDVRAIAGAGVMIEPVPVRNYNAEQAYGGFRVTWKILILDVAPADRATAGRLNQLCDQVVAALSDDLVPVTATPGGYQPDPNQAPYPALILTMEGTQSWL